MFVVGFIGYSGVGKTTLMEKVLARLVSRGRTVSAIKSSHHGLDIDTPGKDSWRYRTAGANEVALVSEKRWSLMRECENGGVALMEILSRMQPVDIVLVEGYKSQDGIVRILVHRKGFDEADLMTEGVVAVATDDPDLVVPEGMAKLDINSPGAVTNFVVTLKADSDHL